MNKTRKILAINLLKTKFYDKIIFVNSGFRAALLILIQEMFKTDCIKQLFHRQFKDYLRNNKL